MTQEDEASIPALALRVDGEAIAAAAVVSVETWTDLVAPPRARIVLHAGSFGTAISPFSEPPPLAPGVALEVAGGYGSASLTTLHAGTVARQGCRVDERGCFWIFESEGSAAPHPPGGDPLLCLTAGIDLVSLELSTGSGIAGACGSVQFRGPAPAIPGKSISLAGIGRLSGDVVIRSVQHRLADGRWRTIVAFGA